MKFNKLFLIIACATIASFSAANGMEKINTFFNGSIKQTATQEQIAHAQVCPICQVEFEDNEKLSVLHCNPTVPHIFHKECLDSWMYDRWKNSFNITCPMCSSAIIPPKWLIVKNSYQLLPRNGQQLIVYLDQHPRQQSLLAALTLTLFGQWLRAKEGLPSHFKSFLILMATYYPFSIYAFKIERDRRISPFILFPSVLFSGMAVTLLQSLLIGNITIQDLPLLLKLR